MTQHTVDLLDLVLRTTHRIAQGLTPDDLARPTPCDEFDARRLLEHVIGWQLVTGACAADLEPPVAAGSPTYRASSDLAADLMATSTTLLTNLRRRSDLTISMPYRGVTSADVVHAEQLAEAVIHTWDLAAAVGVSLELDDDVVSAAHDGLSLLLGESFAEMGFRSPTAEDPEATGLVRLLVRSGRAPEDWA